MKRIVFSPHIDDAFLSLGGSILNWRKSGEKVLIVNIFSISNFSKGEAGDKEKVTEIRKEEEMEVKKETGVESLFLDFPEALLRGYKMRKEDPFYPDSFDESIDGETVKLVGKEVSKYFEDSAMHYFPLAIGEHVDHVLVKKIGEKVLKEGKLKYLSFYEEIPYVGWFGVPEEPIKELDLKPRTQPVDVEKKVEIAKKYSSQIEEEWVRCLVKHANSISREGGYERVWIKEGK